jgi:hypothetical protein
VSRELEDELAAVVTAYDEGTAQLRAIRDEAIRAAVAKGLRQVDVARVTGYNRETIRQIVSVRPKGEHMNTDRMRARAEAVRDAAAEREAAEKQASFRQTPLGQAIEQWEAGMAAAGRVLAAAFTPQPQSERGGEVT